MSLWPKVVELVALSPEISTIREAIASAVGNEEFTVRDALGVAEVEHTLRTLCDYDGQITSYELSELQKDAKGRGISEEGVSRVLQWAEKLSIVDDTSSGYRLDAAWLSALKSSTAGDL